MTIYLEELYTCTFHQRDCYRANSCSHPALPALYRTGRHSQRFSPGVTFKPRQQPIIRQQISVSLHLHTFRHVYQLIEISPEVAGSGLAWVTIRNVVWRTVWVWPGPGPCKATQTKVKSETLPRPGRTRNQARRWDEERLCGLGTGQENGNKDTNTGPTYTTSHLTFLQHHHGTTLILSLSPLRLELTRILQDWCDVYFLMNVVLRFLISQVGSEGPGRRWWSSFRLTGHSRGNTMGTLWSGGSNTGQCKWRKSGVERDSFCKKSEVKN